jgi:hypothetical protein
MKSLLLGSFSCLKQQSKTSEATSFVERGLVNIKLPKTNEGHWQISIINTFGKTITQQLVANGTNVTAFSINNSKGLHTLKVMNTITGKQFINKLIVQ